MKPGRSWSIRTILAATLCVASCLVTGPAYAALTDGAPTALFIGQGFGGAGFLPVPGQPNFFQVPMTAFPGLPSGNALFAASGTDANALSWNLLVEITPTSLSVSIGSPTAGAQTTFPLPNGAEFDITWSTATVLPTLIETSHSNTAGLISNAGTGSFAQPTANTFRFDLGALVAGDLFVFAPAAAPVSPVPEPSTGALSLAGLLTLGLFVHRRRRIPAPFR